MTTTAGSPQGQWRRVFGVYVIVLVVAAASCALALRVGGDIDPTPELSTRSTVAGEGRTCLGSPLIAIQSGIFLELHTPGPDGGPDAASNGLLSGTIDRSTGTADLRGHCADEGSLAGAEAVASIDVREEAVSTGVVTVEGRKLDVTLTEQTGDGGDQATGEPLTGSELVAHTLLAIAVVLLASRAAGAVFERFRLTRVMGEILAGIILGPSLLGAIWPQATEYLFPSTVTAQLSMIGQFGLIFFMFLVGLELNRRLVVGLGRGVVLVSHLSIVTPFAVGIWLAVLIYPHLGRGSFEGFALFLGAAMAITAFPVLARILTDTGLSRTPLGALALTCAAVDDLTAWCLLAAVVAIVKASGGGEVVITLLLTFGFTMVMGLLVRPALRHLAIALERRGRLSQTLVPGVLICLLLSSWATEMIGVHVIFGAFLLGVVMPRRPTVRHELEARLADVTTVFLLPVFFAAVGLTMRVSVLDRTELWIFTGLIILAACLGKFGGSLVAARVLGYGMRESAALGLLMNTRGLTEIVILTVGRELGVVTPALFVMLVIMALVTTIMATPLLAILYSPAEIAAMAEAETARAQAERTSPTHPSPGDAGDSLAEATSNVGDIR